MQHFFEIYLLEEELTKQHWQKLYDAILQLGGRLERFNLIFSCQDNVVRLFIESNKDLSALSNKLEGLLLRPVAKETIELPRATAKERFVQFHTGGNILDLKEKLQLKRSKELVFVRLAVRTIHSTKALVKGELFFKGISGSWHKNNKTFTTFPAHLFAINFAANTHYLKKTIPMYLDIEKSMHMLTSDNLSALLEVDTFPYLPYNYYLNITNYEFDKHSFIVGASGSGKSKFISLFVDRLQKTALKMNYRVVVIDPHASLAADFVHIPETKIINFDSETTQLFSGASTDISAATELTTTLFKSLMADQFNPKIDRLLRFSLFVLFTAQNMSLDTLKRFLTEVELRNQILEHVSGYVPTNIVQFFGADFNELRTKYHNEAISPIVSFVDEMQLQPVLVGEGELSLAKTIEENFLTVFSLNKVSMGEKVVKTVAGLLIQQIFLLAQARAFGQKVILIIDEVSVVQNPALASILAEARKFNLSVMLTQQYFGQIDKDLRDAIFANVYNYYTFKVSEEDARALEGNLKIELPKELLEEAYKKGLKEPDMRVKIMTELHPRECLVRVLSGDQVMPAVKARTMDAPTTSAAALDPAKLESYKKAPAALPTKFDEQQAQISSQPPGMDNDLTMPVPPTTLTRQVSIEQPTGQTRTPPHSEITSAIAQPLLPQPSTIPAPAMQQTTQAGLFNLSDLLAEQSSSRLKVTKRKES